MRGVIQVAMFPRLDLHAVQRVLTRGRHTLQQQPDCRADAMGP
eukprot:COSAG05_NODE_7086_length_857_cov_1.410290_1_plen_42_part_01